MVNTLVGLHAVESVAFNIAILPVDVPIIIFSICDFELIHLGACPHNGVVAVAHVHHQLLSFVSPFALLRLLSWRFHSFNLQLVLDVDRCIRLVLVIVSDYLTLLKTDR